MDKQSLVDLIKNITPSEFGKSVDLHMHSKFSDGRLEPCELLDDAEKKGYRLISICDHNTVGAYTKTSLAQSPIIIAGAEFDCWYKGVLIHILGYGINCENESLKKICAKTKSETEADWVRLFKARKPEKVINAIHEAGGIAVLAHPACCWCFNLEKFVKSLKEKGLDGIEVYYPYKRHRGVIKFHLAKNVLKIGKKYNLILTGGSDSHGEIQKFEAL